MDLIWINKSDYLYGSTKQFKFAEKLAIFDLDDTLIKTKSKKKFPIDKDDWEWTYENVPSKLKEMYNNGYAIMIMSNQAGIEKGKNDPNVWMNKIDSISNKLNLEIRAFCSTGHNKYRKPLPTFFHEIIPNAVINNLNFKLTFYCGDCAGRKNDRTDTDYKFALNCLINFKTPEEFFMNKKENLPKVRYPDILENNSCNNIKKFKPQEKEIIIMVGCQGSGKSFISNELSMKHNYTIINQDTLKTKGKCLSFAKQLTSESRRIIIDSTNPSKESRKFWIDFAKENNYTIRVILMTTSVELSKHNNYYRHITTGCKLIPDIAYNVFKSHYEPPTTSEGIKEIIKEHCGTPENFSYYYYMF